jgi:NADP-dependent 3-hydroxy acid dehydrogenase YdfG
MKLQGKVAVITGGASGLGRRTAEYFVRDKGATVAVESPKRFGDIAEFASLCAHICENAYLNGECVRLEAAARLRAG